MYRKLILWLRARNLNRLKNKTPIILSDNCWGGSIYNFLHLEYCSPLIGTYVYPDSFIKLFDDFPLMFQKNMEFTSYPSRGRRKEEPEYYPVGIINDTIEIHFLHYKSEAEAIAKWTRRSQRMLSVLKGNNELYIKMDDSNFASKNDFISFHNIKFGNKISFSKEVIFQHPNHFKIKCIDEWVSGKNSSHNMDLIHWLNTGVAKQTLVNKLIRPIYNSATYD